MLYFVQSSSWNLSIVPIYDFVNTIVTEAKVICDALKKRKGDNRFLFDDDSQIVRLLVWKILRKEDPLWDTDSYDISFRVYDSNKPMTLTQVNIM